MITDMMICGWLVLHVQGQALENGGWETTCWGCRLRLLLPVFAPIFKCGWCGAITIYKPPAKPRSQWSPTLEIARDRVLVVAVLLLIVSIVCEHPKLHHHHGIDHHVHVRVFQASSMEFGSEKCDSITFICRWRSVDCISYSVPQSIVGISP
jgi:hypothetical protein